MHLATAAFVRWIGWPRWSGAIALLLMSAVCVGGPRPVLAQPSAASRGGDGVDPEDLRALSELLAKPSVREWLKGQAGGPPPAARAARPRSVNELVGQGIDAARAQMQRLRDAVPELPAQLAIMRDTLAAEIRAHGRFGLLGPLVLFGLLGALFEQLFWRATPGLRHRLIALPVDTVDQRLAAAGWRTLYALGVVAAFTAGSLGAFLALDWPALLQEVVLTYLLVFLVVRLTLVGGRVVLAPGAERFRLLPTTTATARYWFVWSALLIGGLAFAEGTYRLVPMLGATPAARTLIGIGMSFVLLVLALAAIWCRPPRAGDRRRHPVNGPLTWMVSIWLAGIWITAFTGETAAFNLGILILLVVMALLGLRRAVDYLLRPDEGDRRTAARPIAVVAVERGLRALLLLVAGLAVTHSLGLDLAGLAASDALTPRIVRAVLNVTVVALVADLVWQISRAWIDHRVADATVADGTTRTEEQLRHRQRLLTLLPILRNLLLIVLVVLAGLTALASIGIEVGPLVAGAGVVGIAVGFGAQTLVKDVISGLFFLFDDAFRVGEYIESGRIKGTVESFSLRSVKLRHHRGPLHTVPFGALSAITNYSRDWAVDKITLGLAYDTDLDHVRRVVKEIGRTLQADPEFEPHILEPLKMQGVDAFGDFAIQVQLKMMTRPGEQQYAIRHRAHALIKDAFRTEGIRFAYPTVTIAGNGDAGLTAAAQTALGRSGSRDPAGGDGG